MADGPVLLSSLLDIFAYAGKVDALLVTLAMMEFDNDSLDASLLLRNNSHLTSAIKVFAQRFGRQYFQDVTSRLLDYIVASGDLGLADPSTCDIRKTRRMIVTCLNTILRTGPLVPPELRHLGSVMRAAASLRFNQKQAVFLTLSTYFCLRFVSASMMDSAAYGYGAIPPQVRATVLTPFVQLLVAPMGLSVYDGIFEPFRSCNHHLINHIFPRLMEFVFSLADIEHVPEYATPDKERLHEAIDSVIGLMMKNREAFETRYSSLLDGGGQRAPVNWNFGVFLMSFFQDSIPA
jgi:hypothetical protein